VHNRPWTLPAAAQGAAAAVTTTDAAVVEDPAGAAERVAASIEGAVRKSRGVELSASEVFCDYRRVRLVNSRGLDLSREDTSVYTEYVLLAKGAAADEIEVYQSKRARRVDDLALDEAIESDVQATQDSLRAALPTTEIVDVVLGGQGVEEIFDAFVAHASGPGAFEGWTRFKAGAPILAEAAGDRLTIVSDATLPGALGTFAFDDVGLPGGRHVVVADGVFQARVNEQRYACWLEEPATGAWGNTVVSSGTTPEAELLVPGARPLYHLLRFSQLSPHAYSGAFSGEIRLGYRVEPDGRRTPIRGGSVSGVVFDAFQRARLSVERTVKGRTHAPRAVRLDRVQITGA
jgi:predicted Zn-dependent protease